MPSRALKNLTRRELIRRGLLVSGGMTAAAAYDIPSVMEQVVYAAAAENVKNDETIGMIQLAGGSDGLRTVIPLTDNLDGVRPGFGSTVIQNALSAGTQLNADFALNPRLKNIARRFKQGQVAILMDVSYPMPSRSHFEATQIWQTGDPTHRQLSGTFGRLAPFIDAQGHPLALCSCGSTTVPGILRGAPSAAVLPTNPATYGFKGGVEQALATLWRSGMPGVYGPTLTQLMDVARGTTTQLKSIVANYKPQGAYDAGAATQLVFASKNNLSRNLQVAAALIKGGAAPTVFTTTLGGWDTHEDEANREDALLGLFDEAVDAFLNDTATAGKTPTIAIYSEFGRTIRVNSSGGTDHGEASPMLVIGQRVKGGVYGLKPNLSGSVVPMQMDFRSMYATLIDHLGVDPKAVVGNFPIVPFMNNGPAPVAVVNAPVAPAATPTPTPRPSATPSASPRPSASPSASPTP